MEEKKPMKIGKVTIAFLMIILSALVILVTVMCMQKLNEEENKEANKNEVNEIKQGEPNPIPEPVPEPVEVEDFDLAFLKLENKKENMLYSPLSIKYALSMLNEGTEGNTKAQIEKVIGNLELTKYDNIDKVLSLANGLFIRDTYAEKVNENYKNVLSEKYNAEIKYDAFENAENVNNWIENKTLGIIKNMLNNEVFKNPDLKLILANALAIDMEWESQFDAEDTYGKTFYKEDGTEIEATTMNKRECSNEAISYYKDSNVTALSMDLKKYDYTQLEFVAIMPNENNLSDYVSNVKIEDINSIINNMKPTSQTKDGVNISIPRFEFDYNLKLKEDLQKLGITDIFDESLANLSQIGKDLYVSDALHKADIEFTEKGVKAAAVTVFFIADNAMIQEPTHPEEINIDKPFLYLIRDKQTGEIWFVGTVYEPNEWENDKADYERR